ncbi:Rad4-domain-containing protein [Xylariaceae sp. FL1019]|nr:Rad4-domain-containing protein [Xylariaceae sp. FL1019]
MVGRKRKAPAGQTSSARASTSSRQTRSSARQDDVPDIYRNMLKDAQVQPAAIPTSPDRPIKRRRPGQRPQQTATSGDFSKAEAVENSAAKTLHVNRDPESESDDDVQFEDVAVPTATIQTVYLDADDDADSDEDEADFEDVDFAALHASVLDHVPATPADIELDLSARTKNAPTRTVDRRKPINKVEKDRRIEIHKTHLLCLLSHVARRNRWCNDTQVQDSLRPLLSKKMIKELNPPSRLTQFGQANSIKEGLAKVNTMFNVKFQTTERGMRRALWAEKEEHLKDYSLPPNAEAPMDKSDFREAAKTLEGSRDVGAQLYCALLRSAGVDARLVCSLQPLSFSSAGPYMGAGRKKKEILSLEQKYGQLFKDESPVVDTSGPLPPRRRLGHPSAAAFKLPEISSAPSHQMASTADRIRESPYPVYWVEVLDVGHQKWQPTDPLATESIWKAQKLEPPATDRENCMTYVVGFEDDGTARDITRRYTKAYNAKTRKLRIESVARNGDRWWRKALGAYSRGFTSDLDQIETNELAAAESREPMPRNIADFKDHPVYALERHFRRQEVLVPGAKLSGTVGAGSTGPLEKIYRRTDVRIARSREKWYRLGREVKPDEIPAKFLTKLSQMHEDLFSDDISEMREGETNGTPIYTIDQTDLYKPPPVSNGRVPKNRYGNLDLYVPSMVPDGGTYIADELGARAAYILGIDYAPALTGFLFKGRKGTAVLHGIVVATEHEEAVRVVVSGLREQEAETESERRRREALRLWRRFLMNLRIRERIWAGAESDDADGDDVGDELNRAPNSPDSADSPDVDEDGGGFEMSDDYGGGGFALD